MAHRFRPRDLSIPLSLAALMALAACDPSTPQTPQPYPAAGAAQPGGLAPSIGGTGAEREAVQAYYRGPRGDEF